MRLRLRLLRRRLTISAPRMAVRNALPWPLRWLLVALVLGFGAALALWAFEFGKGLAGLDRDAREELVRLRAEVSQLREERDRAQSVANTSGSLVTTERAAQEQLARQVRQLQAENATLRDDLGFFERLLPAADTDGIAIRGLQVDRATGAAQLRWQVLVVQPVKGAPEFRGRLDLALAGSLDGKPWSLVLPGTAQSLVLRQYRRLEGVVELPPQVVVNNVTARVLDGATVRATRTLKL